MILSLRTLCTFAGFSSAATTLSVVALPLLTSTLLSLLFDARFRFLPFESGGREEGLACGWFTAFQLGLEVSAAIFGGADGVTFAASLAVAFCQYCLATG